MSDDAASSLNPDCTDSGSNLVVRYSGSTLTQWVEVAPRCPSVNKVYTCDPCLTALEEHLFVM